MQEIANKLNKTPQNPANLADLAAQLSKLDPFCIAFDDFEHLKDIDKLMFAGLAGLTDLLNIKLVFIGKSFDLSIMMKRDDFLSIYFPQYSDEEAIKIISEKFSSRILFF